MGVTRSKDIGTQGETQVARWFQTHGFPYAKRITLHGNKDIGDVHLGDGVPVVVEVKAGKAAESASDTQLREWLMELATEVVNATDHYDEAQYGVLVVKRKAHGAMQVGGWWALTVYEGSEVVRWRLDEFTDHYLTRFMPASKVLERAAIRDSWDDDE